MSLIVPHEERKSIPAEYPVWFPFKTLRVREIHRMEQVVRGYSVVPLVFFSQSTVVL